MNLRWEPQSLGISSGRNNKKNLVMHRRTEVNLPPPVRLTPKPSTSKVDIGKRGAVPSIMKTTPDLPIHQPCRQVPIKETSDELDGICVLPSTAAKDQILKSSSKKQGTAELKQRTVGTSASSIHKSGIPRRRSVVVAKKRLHMSHKETAPNKGVKSRVGAATRLSSHLTSPNSNSTDSTDQFEADELATAMPTPAPNRRKLSSGCQSNCSEALLEMRKLHKDVVTSHKEFLTKATANFEKQNTLIQQQTEVLTKLNCLLDKNIQFYNRLFPSNDSFSNDKENDVEEAKKKFIGSRATRQYNDIRTEFNFLSLKTPGKFQIGNSGVSPKTPKSLLSRTLQTQLGDLFEQS